MPKGRTKIKSSSSKGSAEDANLLNNMFDQMTGLKDADSTIILPKFIKLKTNLEKIHKIHSVLLQFKLFIDSFPEYKEWFDAINLFTENIKESLSESKTDKADSTLVNNEYKKMKASSEVRQIMITTSKLGKYKNYIGDVSNLSESFINREPGLSLIPLSYSKLDLKTLWASDKMTKICKKYILTVISRIYNIGTDIYKIITSPDIDIKKFSTVLIDSINKMRKQIPRCDNAFNIIADSVKMLETNFSGYYRNSVEAENPSIIIESFIVDVSVKQKSSPRITQQFKKIVMFMRKRSSSTTDPRVKKLFKMLNSQFGAMDGNAESPPEPSQPEPSQPEPSQPEPSPPEPSQPEPSQPEPSQPEPSQPEPSADSHREVESYELD
jgi:hypothetical protein